MYASRNVRTRLPRFQTTLRKGFTVVVVEEEILWLIRKGPAHLALCEFPYCHEVF